MKVLDYYFDGDDLIVITEDGEYRLIDWYWSDFRIEGLDYESTEDVTIELTLKYDEVDDQNR